MFAACTDLVDLSVSRDDIKFMNIVEDSVMQCTDGH